MSLMVKDTGGGDFTPVPEGTHLAVCNMVVDLGLQETTYMGQTTTKEQVFIRWELPSERIEWTDKEGQKREGPMSIGKIYTKSLSEKANLRKDLEQWRGKAFTPAELDGFDLFKILGVGCQVSVTHREKDGRTYANVTGVVGWPKGMKMPEKPENELLRYSPDEPGQRDLLPDWLRDKIAKTLPPDHQAFQADDPGPVNAPLNQNLNENLNDDIPL